MAKGNRELIHKARSLVGRRPIVCNRRFESQASERRLGKRDTEIFGNFKGFGRSMAYNVAISGGKGLTNGPVAQAGVRSGSCESRDDSDSLRKAVKEG